MGDKIKNTLWQKYKKYIIDFSLGFLTIPTTLIFTDEFKKIDFIKNNNEWIVGLLILLWIFLLFLKLKFEIAESKKLASFIDLQEKYEKQKNETKRLIQMIDALKYQISGSWNAYLFEIYKELKFDNNYRITVYLYTTNQFVSLARYSNNPEYCKFGRHSIDNHAEFIYKAWTEGECIGKIDNPDITRNMLSRKIGVYYLYSKNDHTPQKDKFGIVVFETTNKNKSLLNHNKLKAATEKINDFIIELMDIKPDINIAIKEGL